MSVNFSPMHNGKGKSKKKYIEVDKQFKSYILSIHFSSKYLGELY
jgi:hypothetical protein